MKLSEFNFELPEHLIADRPTEFREDSRLMLLNKKTGEITHLLFKDIVNYFGNGDTFVFNNTKVIPARLYGKKEKTDARVEVFLLRELNPEIKLWDVLVDPARKIRIGNKLFFGENEELCAEVIDNTVNGGRTLRFLYDSEPDEFKEYLYSLGQTPIPRYMNREAEDMDAERFQTLFAEEEGAVISPAAGLHFSPLLLKKLEVANCNFAKLTLHNGLGNFQPQEIEDLSKHRKNNEQMSVNEECCAICNKAKDEKKHIIAVGTSVFRALETAVCTDGYIRPFDGWTNKYIYPPYNDPFQSCLITNFHMSESLLLIMTAAMGGFENVMNAYKTAIEEGYRFGAYGDAMLIM